MRSENQLPTFVIIGAMKAGTTSLAAYLGAHPDVFMASPKEPNFFSDNWDAGVSWYERRFEAGAAAIARGEASTGYTKAPQISNVPARLSSVVPDARLVYLIRNPVDRIRSMYAEFVDRSAETRSLPEAVAEDSRYVDWSSYGYQLDQYLGYFDRTQILVVGSDDLRSERELTLAGVLQFIGVAPRPDLAASDRERNLSVDKRRLWSVVRGPRALLERAGLLSRIPVGAKRRLRRAVGAPINDAVDPDLEAEIWARLAPDLARLRSIVGPDFDLWGRA